MGFLYEIEMKHVMDHWSVDTANTTKVLFLRRLQPLHKKHPCDQFSQKEVSDHCFGHKVTNRWELFGAKWSQSGRRLSARA